jgi:hypothetical protein
MADREYDPPVEPLNIAVGDPKPRDSVKVPKLAVSAKTGTVAIVAIAAYRAPLLKWPDRLNNMVILLAHYCKFTHCSPQNLNLGGIFFFTPHLQASVPYFYQGTGGFDRTLSDTHSIATRERR